MLPVRFGPKDLLEFSASYGVIICRECRYAIQKSALQSHLLRHKIFRHERHSLLNSIARLDILEPDAVPLPPPTSKPIDALPIISGFRCDVADCGSLYASAKRMRRHQLESHAASAIEVSDFPNRAVTLQTFFRVTKIRYFEVTSVDSSTTSESELAPGSPDDSVNLKDDELEGQGDVALNNMTTKYVPPCASTSGDDGFDLQSLVYFNHFITVTSCSLPSPDPKQPLYWQTEFVNQALRQKWLVADLLALSASHMRAIAHKASAATTHHHHRSAELRRIFEDGGRMHTQGVFNTSHQGKPTPREGILGQISSILKCAHIVFPVRMDGRQATLEQLITSISDLSTTGAMLRPSALYHSNENVFDRAARLLNTRTFDPVLATFLRRLEALPTRMAEALGRPDDLRDVVTALSAIAAFEASEDSFWIMAEWLSGVADDFHQMLAQDKPAALIVLAHWAASLVVKVEEDGCWFLDGAAQFIMSQVQERLPPDPCKIRSLIENLEI